MTKRASMLGSEIRSLIAPVLRECPRECRIVSITAVDVSDDFSYATVLISALRETEAALAFLNAKRSALQAGLSSLTAHRTPKLRFRIDRSVERAARVDALLEKAFKKKSDDTSKSPQHHPERL